MSARAPIDALSLLHQAFGFASFRGNQEEVCQATIAGRDVLLVMPTGAGKSLCYQLPAIALGGTALVVSPLIALMDDQAAKLAGLGFSVARIHSGLDRSVSRQACIDYLKGSLQFLFIAPERLRVPGFPEMLAKRKPALVAIDEAHCISQWGHDFRPDYRTLGQYLPALRPAPIIALTATATPRVQDDIVAQLQLRDSRRFIHGFRRDNLSIEVVEVSRPRRTPLVIELLKVAERRPAIVYAPTRKEADALALELSGHFPAAAYHAGLSGQQREQVQSEFLSGRTEVVVATIAFGMGIDKADIRSVIHTALPGSLEGYYQEIGRAGRDGRPSRTILMHSWADRRTHDFFLERDYPQADSLDKLYRALGSEPRSIDELRDRLNMEPDVFDRCLEKLAIHGGATVDYDSNVVRGKDAWRGTYTEQYEQRRSQIDKVLRFAQGNACRMASLVRHFGDVADGRHLCGHCDFCSPERAIAQKFREANGFEQRCARDILRELGRVPARSTGKLHQELFAKGGLTRDALEALLGAMASAGLITLEDAEFEAEGRTIPYCRASLTEYGRELDAGDPLSLLLREDAPEAEGKPRTSSGRSSPARKKPAGDHNVALTAEQSAIESRLKEWRLAEAARLKQPAFCVLSNKVLTALAVAQPASREDLLTIEGIGPAKADRFGSAICRICTESST